VTDEDDGDARVRGSPHAAVDSATE
jgi:hypothetical protein